MNERRYAEVLYDSQEQEFIVRNTVSCVEGRGLTVEGALADMRSKTPPLPVTNPTEPYTRWRANFGVEPR